MYSLYTKIASILMATAIILGAFGAHSLNELITPERLSSWKTGVFYMVVHSLAIFILSLNMNRFTRENQKIARHSMLIFLCGILFFSGSIYLLSIQNLLGINPKWVGPVTPIGGVLFIVAWLNLTRLRINLESNIEVH